MIVKKDKIQRVSCLMLAFFIISLRKKCPCSELFWSALSRIRTEYGEIIPELTPNTATFYEVFVIQINQRHPHAPDPLSSVDSFNRPLIMKIYFFV